MKHLHYQEVLEKYKTTGIDRGKILSELREMVRKDRHKIVVLDDDPTGVQTVHDIYVYTSRQEECLRDGFLNEEKLFYVMTNSRAFTKEQTVTVHEELARTVFRVSKRTGQDFILVSRGDSTLRGHFPLETQVLSRALQECGQTLDGEILFPFFKEGGRFTVADVHYVESDGWLIPAGETEFAGDPAFGYHASDLKAYIEEKTEGNITAKDVVSISLEQLRAGKVEDIIRTLMQVKGGGYVIVNALDYDDVAVFCLAYYRVLEMGKRFMFRSGASLVKVLGGISDIPYLDAAALNEHFHGWSKRSNGGLILVGSYTGKTTGQLERLKEGMDITFIPFQARKVLEGQEEEEILRVRRLAEESVAKGISTVIYTERLALTADGENRNSEDSLKRSVAISNAVCRLVLEFQEKPRYMVAKGGITSADVAVKGLAVEKALVLGQMAPGIPVLKTGAESRFPDMPYVIFPGNVGRQEMLLTVVETLETSGQKGEIYA